MSRVDESGYFYVIWLREHRLLRLPVYKVGVTQSADPNTRTVKYPPGSTVKISLAVRRPYYVETCIKNALATAPGIKRRKDLGHEYYEGDLRSIFQMAYFVCAMNLHDELDDACRRLGVPGVAKEVNRIQVHRSVRAGQDAPDPVDVSISSRDQNQHHTRMRAQLEARSLDPALWMAQRNAPNHCIDVYQRATVDDAWVKVPGCRSFLDLDRHLARQSACVSSYIDRDQPGTSTS